MQNINLITPETARTSHYFWAQAHDFTPRDPAVTAAILDAMSDLGGVHVRRTIDRALRREREGVDATAGREMEISVA